jgi:hypothetical protein
MTMATIQERYFNLLMERVREDRYPSGQLMDRIEAGFWNGEQIVQYVDLLLQKIDETHYPSGQMLDRVQRMLTIVAAAS